MVSLYALEIPIQPTAFAVFGGKIKHGSVSYSMTNV